VILGDAPRDPAFASDRYIAACRPRSILCLSLTHQGRLTGLLYIENKATVNAFPPARVELLSLIAGQAAIAIENARLYQSVSAVTEELREANQQLTIELTERARAEEGRAALQAEIIRAQEDRLSELSTPLIPIADGIVVMPLIGTIDAGRAQQALETALHGAQTFRAKIVILDITGVNQVDGGVASSLLRTASALRLLGTEVVLSGIRPEVAQTFIRIDVDLSSIVTQGTLQSSVAWALAKIGGARRSSSRRP
jgi:anti-anti-sigma regulatory factor